MTFILHLKLRYTSTTNTKNSGEMESTSSSERRNFGCVGEDRKKHGHRADLLFKSNRSEFGCCEAGKEDNGNESAKEKFESNLKAPKMMKDMLQSLSSSFPLAKNLATVGYIISGIETKWNFLTSH